ncbi:MAG: hydrolase 1, exosortase A system-associated [Erythrobacter sp.]|nr:hydrolase 1, exosortase A system-associated [Erythrobacter sp.]
MSRLHLTFACGSCTLAGTLDTAPGQTGLLIVSGGNEIRAGAFGGQAALAAAIARAGFPVFRFDRRGIGDSEGENRGYRASARDIASAREAFRAIAPDVERVVALGNCDAASALMLAGGEGFEGLILSNPWTIEAEDGGDSTEPATMPAASIRQRYAEKLRNPREVARLLRGGVDLRKLARGLAQSVRSASPPSGLADEMRSALATYQGRVSILLAGADRTAQAFRESWEADDARISLCEGAGHAYVVPEHRAWLEAKVLAALRAVASG